MLAVSIKGLQIYLFILALWSFSDNWRLKKKKCKKWDIWQLKLCDETLVWLFSQTSHDRCSRIWSETFPACFICFYHCIFFLFKMISVISQRGRCLYLCASPSFETARRPSRYSSRAGPHASRESGKFWQPAVWRSEEKTPMYTQTDTVNTTSV